jgi:triacylglycerol lipase
LNLVFAHGYLGWSQTSPLGINYFRGLQAHITRLGGHAALFPQVPPLGTYEDRARALADAIQQAYPEGPVHIIAHSMGGLDSRALIARNLHGLSNAGRIASLTTLSTPHHGSPVADLLAGPRPHGPRRLLYDGVSRAIGLLGIDTGALANLTAEGSSKVPDVVQTHPHIRYRSYVGSGRVGLLRTCATLIPCHQYISAVTGQQNDGLVAQDSAQYGEVIEPFWRCDHFDMVGHNLDTADLVRQFDHLAAFDAIISRL